MTPCFVITILGAESTGKSTLARELGEALNAAVVAEYLREFCDVQGRTPRPQEQPLIAAEQTRRIAAAAADHAIVIADTSALMIAVYSEQVFGDRSLYAQAAADHARANLTLLTALDLPWQADGLQRDGPHVRAPVDELVRAALLHAGLDFSVVTGSGPARLEAALRAVRHAIRERAADEPSSKPETRVSWQWHCERCGDAACERHRLPRG